MMVFRIIEVGKWLRGEHDMAEGIQLSWNS